jgi:uncharacterized protein (DUF488 family)
MAKCRRLPCPHQWETDLSSQTGASQCGILLGSNTDVPTFRWVEKEQLKEMNVPAASQSLDVLAALSRRGNFSLGCYCEDERRCHRSQLRALLLERGAQVE